MKTLFIPDYRRSNPYQLILAEALARKGVEVGWGKAFPPFPVMRAVGMQGLPDVLHLHWQHPFIVGASAPGTVAKGSGFAAELMALKALGVRLIWTVHNIVGHEGRHARIEVGFNRVIARLCDGIIAHTPSIRKEVMRVYRLTASEKVRVIPHPSYAGHYLNTIGREEARRRLGIRDGEFVFLFFGAVKRYKGVGRLIESFSRIGEARARLLIAGLPQTGEIAREIAAACGGRSNITVNLSFVPGDAVQQYMNAADVVALPYEAILTSGAAVLAMSFGKPLIVPAIGGIPDTLDEGGAFFYDGAAAGALLDAMERALRSDRGVLEEMGARNLSKLRGADADDIAEMTLELYKPRRFR